MTFKTADLCDDHGTLVQVALPGMKNFGGNSRFSGPLVTIDARGDFSRVREQVTSAGNGRVLVVDNQGSMDCALLGDLLAAAAISNGWSGIVINGCIRDSADIAAMAIGVKALATIPRKGARNEQGDVDVEVEFCGIRFHPGDYLYSDEDGIITSPKALL
ncbi:MAG: regulator of ribonuclease activity A [Gammaproteobacteria bacterium]|jgi:regulator of ribonuclease activity A